MLALAFALQTAELPPPPVGALAEFLYWDQCVVYGAEAMAGSNRSAEEIVETKMRDCRDHERRVQAELDGAQPDHAAERMTRFRSTIREQTLRAIAARRQPAPSASK